MAEPKPLYRKALELARALGELPQWRESRKENIACARAIDKAIADGYDGMHLREGIPAEIAGQFGMDRVAWVLASTLHEKQYDGRFSRENKTWGEAQRITYDQRAYEYCCNAHPVLVNDVIDDFRKLQQEAVQTPETLRIRIYQINRDRDPDRHRFENMKEFYSEEFLDDEDTVYTDEQLEAFWTQFGAIPMDPETERMEDDFLCFPRGTHREEIWHWFDKRHSKGVVYLLYGETRNETGGEET